MNRVPQKGEFIDSLSSGFEGPRCTKHSLHLNTSVNDCAYANGDSSSESDHMYFFFILLTTLYELSKLNVWEVSCDELERSWKEAALIALLPRH
jgi:hypothetical protein